MTSSRTLRLLASTMLGAASFGAACAANAAPAAERFTRVNAGTIITPASSIALPEDAGIRAHTNVQIFVPRGQIRLPSSQPTGNGETPASLACVYGLTPKALKCNPQTLKTVATTGQNVVAIVDAFDDPNAASDLAVYSTQWGLPAPTAANFQVVYASGKQPPQDSTGGWELEESLDVDMAHALAPNAKVILVEAKSNSTKDLLAAEAVASKLVAEAGGGEVSNSWSGSETSGEEKYEKDFATAGVVYFASTGDSPGTGFPSILTNVIGVGGTVIDRTTSGDYKSQESWPAGGGGSSPYVPRPSYQDVVQTIVGSQRGVPDISLDASPVSGAWVYDTIKYNGTIPNWIRVGGTSLASPALAAVINSSGAFNTSTVAELIEVYGDFTNKKEFTDITKGSCNNGGQTAPTKGWDYCTGVGVPLGTAGK